MNHAACLYKDSGSNSDSEPEHARHSSNLDTSQRFTMKDSVDNILLLTVAHNTCIQEICILDSGRLLIRAVCMVFDAYLKPSDQSQASHSSRNQNRYSQII